MYRRRVGPRGLPDLSTSIPAKYSSQPDICETTYCELGVDRLTCLKYVGKIEWSVIFGESEVVHVIIDYFGSAGGTNTLKRFSTYQRVMRTVVASLDGYMGPCYVSEPDVRRG